MITPTSRLQTRLRNRGPIIMGLVGGVTMPISTRVAKLVKINWQQCQKTSGGVDQHSTRGLRSPLRKTTIQLYAQGLVPRELAAESSSSAAFSANFLGIQTSGDQREGQVTYSLWFRYRRTQTRWEGVSMASHPKNVGILALDIYFPPTCVQQVQNIYIYFLVLLVGFYVLRWVWWLYVEFQFQILAWFGNFWRKLFLS